MIGYLYITICDLFTHISISDRTDILQTYLIAYSTRQTVPILILGPEISTKIESMERWGMGRSWSHGHGARQAHDGIHSEPPKFNPNISHYTTQNLQYHIEKLSRSNIENYMIELKLFWDIILLVIHFIQNNMLCSLSYWCRINLICCIDILIVELLKTNGWDSGCVFKAVMKPSLNSRDFVSGGYSQTHLPPSNHHFYFGAINPTT